ncbi:hypothetical protein PGLA_24275 [Paenibacillus glacialis]|uniref:Uncharacterized protein n=1 Tax=Paenibacillus glacialis TaxID=494026 RepID=A0A168DA90_9BACL|nr:hypothetical protein PGLA_24275 [Paenibacillus glacialis]
MVIYKYTCIAQVFPIYINHNFKNVTREIQFVLSDYKPTKKPRRILSRHEVLRFLHTLVTYNTDHLERDALLFIFLLSTELMVLFLEMAKAKTKKNKASVYCQLQDWISGLSSYFRGLFKDLRCES